jgi:hypothetical protein
MEKSGRLSDLIVVQTRRVMSSVGHRRIFKEETRVFDWTDYIRMTVTFGGYCSLLPVVKKSTTNVYMALLLKSKESMVS